MYTHDEIRNMIDDYKSMCNLLEEFLPEVDSNSIALYGIESTLPKPQGVNNSKVESSVLVRDKVTKRQQKLIDKIKFVNCMQEQLEDDNDYFFLELWKTDKKRKDVLSILKITKNDYTDMRKNIVEQLYEMQN
ncbi:hypothetical protein BU065_01210 [Staphylococcus succinus]|uniref:hypothetical protein n=1 Tax=Staphylococcus succinus TaxID=61015 RepID=UPI000E67B885|nr:hypothetical protein [Staphylococcus succinus]RIN37024.1 hypothetical protein BU065_01210 [Staphylococcus succinus]